MTIVLLGLAFAAASDKTPLPFPQDDFLATDTVARWLLAYDAVAWRSSDRVMLEPEAARAGLGQEWFCLELADGWHAVYGAYDAAADHYTVVFHYVLRDGLILPSDAPLDEDTMVRYARALRNALAAVPAVVTALKLRFNGYVRPMSDGKLEVWFLPAGQPDGRLVYGGDLHFVYDKDGKTLLDTYLNYERFSVALPDPARDLDIDRSSRMLPSVGDLVFVRTFGDRFASARIWTTCYVTTAIVVEDSQGWLNAPNDRGSCRKERKKRAKREE